MIIKPLRAADVLQRNGNDVGRRKRTVPEETGRNKKGRIILTSCVAFRTDQDGTIFVFSFTLSDQEPYASLYKVMVSSIQLAE